MKMPWLRFCTHPNLLSPRCCMNSRYSDLNMKLYRIFPFLLLLFAITLTAPACSRKSGCPANESLQAKTNKKGDLKKSRKGSSGLFPKKMAKRMK